MKNVEAAQHLREALDGQFRGAFGVWREAMEKAIVALEHQPEPRNGNITAQQCVNCGRIVGIERAVCRCGSTELRPIRGGH